MSNICLGAKMSALKAILQEEIMEKKSRAMQRIQEQFEAEEARRKENEVDEEEMNQAEGSDMEEAELTDGEDGDSDTTESEPDEADIVGDDYGKDEKEPEVSTVL